jgi:uncharacterized protein YjiK
VAIDKIEYGKVHVKTEHALGVQEAGCLAPMGDGSFLVVDDDHGVFRCVPGDDPKPLGGGKGMADVEGITITPDGHSAYVLSERGGSVWRFAVDDAGLHDGNRLGKLPRLSNKKNKGWEGIAFVAAGTFAEKMAIMAVHQKSPRRIGLFDAETLEQHSVMRLPKNARKVLGELNDIAVGRDGRILLLSGKSGRIAEVRLEGEKLSLVCVYRVETSKHDVPEGISIDAEGAVWICTDGEGMLRQLDLTPG